MKKTRSMNRAAALAMTAVAVAMACLLGAGGLRAQKYPGFRSFADYINSNSKFGTKMFRALHGAKRDQNVVFSPIGISSLFACLREGTYERKVQTELNQVFEWTPEQDLGIYHRLFAGRFEFPSAPLSEEELRKKAKERFQRMHPHDYELTQESLEYFYEIEKQGEAQAREEFWVKNVIYYLSDFAGGEFNWRLSKARADFWLEFVHIKNKEEWRAAFPDSPDIGDLPGRVAGEYLFLFESKVQLGTKWLGNTFALHEPKPGDFHPTPGSTVQVTVLPSEFTAYPYAKTDKFEAVVLPAERADFIVILPAEGVSAWEVEDTRVRDPNFLTPLLKKTYGDVELPEFDFCCDTDFQPLLESLGLRETFAKYDLVLDERRMKGLPYKLLGTKQRASIRVDRTGIQAGARTAVWGVLGGVMDGEAEFHMKVNRPFLFQVRDNVTGMLLFMGAVMDPSRHGPQTERP